jgi:hypothetical protein
MRFLIALVVLLGIALQAAAQSSSDTGSNSWTPSWTKSNTNSVTGTGTQTGTGSSSPSVTYPQPPAPVNLVNLCLNHIINVCPSFDDPVGFPFNLYRIYFRPQTSTVVTRYTTTLNSLKITNLTANTIYDVWVQGVNTGVGVWSANSTVVQFVTSPADPKKDTTRDIQNFQCFQIRNALTGRVALNCTWSAALDPVQHVNVKAHCVSAIREPLLIRKRLWGTKATQTWVQIAINRDDATCNVYGRFYYVRRPTTRHSFKIVVS